MCKAKEYTRQLLNIYDDIQTDYNNHRVQLKRHDALQQDLLHAIEMESFNAARGYALAKMIHDMRVERRETKNELETLTVLNNLFVSETKDVLEEAAIKIDNREIILDKEKGGALYKNRFVNGKSIYEKGNNKMTKCEKKKLYSGFIPNAVISTNSKLNGLEVQTLETLEDNKFKCLLKDSSGGIQVLTIHKNKLKITQ